MTRRIPKQTRAKLLDHALIQAGFLVLESSGLQNFSTNKVAEKAGVSIGSLYQYYSNKEELLERMIDRVADELLEEAFRGLQAIKNPTIEFFSHQLLEELFRVFLQNKDSVALLFVGKEASLAHPSLVRNRQIFFEKLSAEIEQTYPLDSSEDERKRKIILEVLMLSFLALVQSIRIEKRRASEVRSLKSAFIELTIAALK